VWGLGAAPKKRSGSVQVACGGSISACQGTLTITFPEVTKRHGQRRSGGNHATYTVLRRAYRVPAESSRTIAFKLPSPAVAIVNRHAREYSGAGPAATVTASVVGGPTMTRKKVEMRLSAAKAAPRQVG
jgi:hypothetical protein